MDAAESSKFSWLVLPVIGIFTLSLFYYFKPRAKLNVKGKYVLITGCDSGFGRLTAIALDKMGVCVLATCLTKEGEQSLKSVTSDKLKTFQLDVTNSEQIKDVYDKVKYLVESETGGLWGLVNNAGIAYAMPIDWTPMSIFKRTADVNLWGAIEVTKTFLPLIKKVQGRVVNVSSVGGRISLSLFSHYSVAKYGVEAFSDALRREMYPWGVKVSILEPGAFHTNILSNLAKNFKDRWEALDDHVKEEYGEEYLNGAFNSIKEFPQSDRLDKVVNAVVEALTSQAPRDRYPVGLDCRLIITMASWLPTSAMDFILHSRLRTPTPKIVQKG
ncbi:Retinol dehydrogenase 5 [Porites harrisoni]